MTPQTKTNHPGNSGSTAGRRSSSDRTPSPRGWSPLTAAARLDAEEDGYWLNREISLLERALEDKGEMRRGELGDLVGCKYWGPRRFARALKAAVDQDRIRHAGFGRYAPVGPSPTERE